MINLIKNSNSVIRNIDNFFDTINMGLLNFKEGVNNYINGNMKEFESNMHKLEQHEGKADSIKRKIEDEFLINSLVPNHASDILLLLEKVDDIIDKSKENLSQFDVEVPVIPDELKNDFIRLTEISVLAADNVIPASRIFFTKPDSVKEKLQKVMFYEREADKLANAIKRKLFREMEDLKHSHKIHLRYFALHIEQISDVAETVANILSTLLIKIRF